jgi:gluconolactonase
MNYEGNRVKSDNVQPNQKEAVYRLDVQTGKLTQVTTDVWKPNGLCFSPDYKKLYVADTGKSHYPDAKEVIHVWDVVGGKTLANGRVFCSMALDMTPKFQVEARGDNVERIVKAGFADGIRADVDGNIWASAGWVGDGYDGVHIFAPDGTRIGQILLPEICSNVCFGGRRRNRLFMTASTSLYAVYVETQGAHIT